MKELNKRTEKGIANFFSRANCNCLNAECTCSVNNRRKFVQNPNSFAYLPSAGCWQPQTVAHLCWHHHLPQSAFCFYPSFVLCHWSQNNTWLLGCKIIATAGRENITIGPPSRRTQTPTQSFIFVRQQENLSCQQKIRIAVNHLMMYLHDPSQSLVVKSYSQDQEAAMRDFLIHEREEEESHGHNIWWSQEVLLRMTMEQEG